jgi:small-conductance mechanosensitive channel
MRNGRDRTRRALAHTREHDWTAALFAGVIAIAALVIGSELGDVHGHSVRSKSVAWTTAVVLLIFGVIAVRRSAAVLSHLATLGALRSAGVAVRLIISGVGYLILIFAEFGLIDVSVTHLLIGAGLAGVVLGIAAQQSLGNVFAAVVLLLARPFVVGDRIHIRSGALGGIFDATVREISLTYVTLDTDEGMLKIPNAVMLATAVGRVGAGTSGSGGGDGSD